MEAATNRWRLIVLTGAVVACFAGLGCRLVELQWARHGEFTELAGNLHQQSYYREATRGDIRDRRGNLLATSVPVKTVCADPWLIKGHEQQMAELLAPILKTNESTILRQLSRHAFTNAAGVVRPVHYVRLKQKVSVDDWEKIRASLTQQYTNLVTGKKLGSREKVAMQGLWLRSITAEDDQIRSYPNGQLAAHVLGFVGNVDVVANGVTNSFVAGSEGIEAAFDPKLRGARGWVKTQADINKKELFMFREQDVQSRPGLSVVLTIDSRIQQIVEEELAPLVAKHSPQSVLGLVIRPKTGEVLAMANLPTFDPNVPGQVRDPGARRNRIITDAFEPGSTAKTMTLAAALNEGATKLTDEYDCENGVFRFAGRLLHDHEHYRVMTVQQIIAKSSNIGTAKVAIRMGQELTHRYFNEFGFGQKTGIPLTGEASGYLPPLKYWKPIHVSRISIGHGVSATPLQTVMAMCAVANGGVLMRPMLVDRLVDEEGNTVVKHEPQPWRRVISESVARSTTETLKTVVEKGTAEKAALEHYTVAGKTGTAQKVVNGQYSHEKYYISFIGYFPASDPELCVLVAVDEPVKKTGYYGGQVAAPVFKRISERAANYLNIKPDIEPPLPDEGVLATGKLPQQRAVVTQVQ